MLIDMGHIHVNTEHLNLNNGSQMSAFCITAHGPLDDNDLRPQISGENMLGSFDSNGFENQLLYTNLGTVFLTFSASRF